MLPKQRKYLKPVLTAEQMSAVDRITIDDIGIAGIVLMENAGRKIVECVNRMIGTVHGKQIMVLCGKGNNGGDGYVVARYLASSGADVRVVLAGDAAALRGDAKTNFDILTQLGIDVLQVKKREHLSAFSKPDLVVDAILGTGVTGAPKPPVDLLVEAANKFGAPVLAVDLPTGINSNTGQVYRPGISADVTVTVGAIKQGLLFSPAREHAGQVRVADIGFPETVIAGIEPGTFYVTSDYYRNVLPKRNKTLYKNRSGQVFVLAGSPGLSGAASLCSEATIRSGAGLAVLGIPAGLNAVMEQKLTEVMTTPLPETAHGSVSFAAKKIIAEKIEWADAVAAGPGLAVTSDTTRLVKWLVKHSRTALVLDADALNCLAGEAELLQSAKASVILTPHAGELARLVGRKREDLLADPVSTVRQVSQELSCILVLKGAPTVVGSPDGDVFINSTGNPGMATGGTGDVLTGVIASLLAQGLQPIDAAVAGVFVHGMAGDIVAKKVGQAGLIASDVVAQLPAAMDGDFTELIPDIEFI